jgi:hypothetical protein
MKKNSSVARVSSFRLYFTMKRLLPIFIVIIFVALPHTAAPADLMREIKLAGPYVARINQLVVQASYIIVETSQYDDLALALANDEVTPDLAGRILASTSVLLKNELQRIRTAADDLPPQPQGITNSGLKTRIFATEAMLRESLRQAEASITDSEALVVAVFTDDSDTVGKVQFLRTTRSLSSLKLQAELITIAAESLSPDSEEAMNFHLLSAQGYGLKALIRFLEIAIRTNPYSGRHPDLLEKNKADLKHALRSLDYGFKSIRNGERETKKSIRTLRGLSANTYIDKANNGVMLEILSTMDESWGVERRYLSLVEHLFDEAFQKKPDASGDFLQKFGDASLILEKRRAELQLSRQMMVGSLR